MATKTKSEWLSVTQVALQLQLSRNTVRLWMSRGVHPGRKGKLIVLRSIRHGSTYRTTQAWLDAFLARCMGKPILADQLEATPAVEPVHPPAEFPPSDCAIGAPEPPDGLLPPPAAVTAALEA